VSEASAPNFVGVGRDDAQAVQKDIAAGSAALREQLAACIQYTPDTVSATQYRDKREYRVARVKCAFCTSTTELNQVRDVASGNWPDERPQLISFGWQFVQFEDGERAFCGKTCGERYALKMRDHGNKPLPPVERVNDASYARRMYQEPAPTKVQVVEETTPARPPASNTPPQKRR
jgi:uncharacterized protein involved in tolerance to divalent cations